ncbi:MAG: BlaI/MecI/CopY family transcriptional regulator [Methylococcales bacterium]|jgi:predicted transcriptional regulator|nr:BlaI/MecI/CopY family transcriptional regulator [Methylococcales bacterium]MBT7408506.1 BlaI/MecI/CopY family transcriptional regulator [Methylococcales bacterium]
MQLGELEKLVLQYLWRHKIGDAKKVHAFFEKSRGGSLNTIQSTLDRLFKKGLLSREKQGHAFVYSAQINREALIAKLIKNITSDFIGHDENSLITAFSSVSSELNEKQLSELEAMIHEQLTQLKNRDHE